MNTAQLHDLLPALDERLGNCVVERLRWSAHGLVLTLMAPAPTPATDNRGERHELAFWSFPRRSWLTYLGQGQRQRVFDQVAQHDATLLSPLPVSAQWRDASVTALDALRAWFLTPVSCAPSWLLLEGCRWQRIAATPGDRVVAFHFQGVEADSSSLAQLVLRVEMLPRSANFFLLDSEAKILARWRDRAPVAPRTSQAPEETAPEPASGDAIALDTTLSRALCDLQQSATQSYLQQERQKSRRQDRRARKLLEKLQRELEEARHSSQWRKYGELITANLHRIQRGQSSLEVEDYYADNRVIEIELDPALSPQEQAARFFKRARRGERGLVQIEARMEELQKQLEKQVEDDASKRPTSWLQAVARSPEGLAFWRSRKLRPRSLWQPGGPTGLSATANKPRPREAPASTSGPGRVYRFAGNWEVRVGRSNQENDELTHAFAKPDDIWLHASGVAGSHVVLRMQGRRGNPPREILIKAAELAARFSKGKHASTVPVVWTFKRYVRKPRRSPSGTASCEREKTIFVTPRIPEGTMDAEANMHSDGE